MVESDAVPFGQRTQAAVVADDAGDLDRKRARPAAMEQIGEAVRARRYRDDRARLRGRLDQPPLTRDSPGTRPATGRPSGWDRRHQSLTISWGARSDKKN